MVELYAFGRRENKNKRDKHMADETRSSALTAEDVRSLKNVFIGTNLIFWILAIFLIWIMYSVNKQLASLNATTSSIIQSLSGAQLSGMQIVEGEVAYDAVGDEQKVVYTIVRPQMPDEYMDPMAAPTEVPGAGEGEATPEAE